MSRFGRIEFSDARYERDCLRFVTFQSPGLRGRGDVSLFVPPLGGKQHLPLVLLLHGVYGSHWSWALKGAAHLTAAEMMTSGELPPMVIAMPSDGLRWEGSGYLPQRGADFEQWIVSDVPQCLREVLCEIGEESPIFICGQSMGGFGALRLGAKYAKQFRAISAHSSITRQDDWEALLSCSTEDLLPSPPAERSVAYWLSEHRHHLPRLRFDCGNADKFIEQNRSLHRDLTAMGITHSYEEFEGGHSWDYWRLHLRDSLRFFARVLE